MLKLILLLRSLSEESHVIRSLGTQALYVEETTAYQFVHFLVHKALYDDLVKEERILLHGIAADVLAEQLLSAEDNQHNVHIVAARLAAHATIAERSQSAAEAYLKGAQWVWKSYSADEALHLIEQCLQTVHSQKAPALALRSVELDALLLKGEITGRRARNSEASAIYEVAITLATDIGTPEQLSCAYRRLSNATIYGGHYAEAETIARKALQIAAEANDMRGCGRALNSIGRCYFNRSMYDQALDYHEQSLQASIDAMDEVARATNLMSIGGVYSTRGNHTLALKHMQDALSVHRSLRDTGGIMMCLSNIGATLANCFMYESAIESFEEALRLARLIGDVRWESLILSNLSLATYAIGRYSEALEFVQSGLAMQQQIGDMRQIAYSYNILGDIYTKTRRFDDALNSFQTGITLATETGDQLRLADLKQSTGFVYLLQGRYAEALQLFEASRKQLAELGLISRLIDSAVGSAWCSLKLEALETAGASIITSSDLLARTKLLVREEDFILVNGERLFSLRLENLSKLGITLDE